MPKDCKLHDEEIQSRPIKFRAWDGKKVFQIDPVWCEEEYAFGDYDFQKCAGDIVLMQFTGLLDRHGKDIYEGDITNYGEVVWVPASAGFRLNPAKENTDANFTESLMNYDDIEVLGNIYENE